MAYPITLNEVKSWSKIDTDDDNILIEQILIPEAVEYCTAFTDPSTLYIDASCPYKVKVAMLMYIDDRYNKRGSYEPNYERKDEKAITRQLMFHRKIKW